MADRGKRDLPATPERRQQRRVRVLLGARIAYHDGAQYFDCMICDLTSTGARISLPKNQPISSSVYLINMRDRTAHEAKVVWNNGKDAGLMFSKLFPLDEIPDPGRLYLNQHWHERAMR